MEMENIKGNQSAMKNKISEMKSTLEGIDRQVEAEDQTNDLKDGVAEDTQSEQQQEKKFPQMKIV